MSSASAFLVTAATASWRFERLYSLTTLFAHDRQLPSRNDQVHHRNETTNETLWRHSISAGLLGTLVTHFLAAVAKHSCHDMQRLPGAAGQRRTRTCADDSQPESILPRREGFVSSRCGQTEWLHHLSLDTGLAVFVRVQHLWVNQEPFILVLSNNYSFYPLEKIPLKMLMFRKEDNYFLRQDPPLRLF